MAVAETEESCLACGRSYSIGTGGKCPYCGYQIQYPHLVDREISSQEIRLYFHAVNKGEMSPNDGLDEYYIISVEGQKLNLQIPYYCGELVLTKSKKYNISITTIYKEKAVYVSEAVINVPSRAFKKVKGSNMLDPDIRRHGTYMTVEMSFTTVEYKKGLFRKGTCGSLKIDNYMVCW